MVLFQENLELSQEQQALLSFIVEAYQKHRIPQDMAKKLVRDISYNSSKFCPAGHRCQSNVYSMLIRRNISEMMWKQR